MEQFKIKWHGFHQNVQRSDETKDSDVVFMQLLNILRKLVQHYYTNKMLFLTVQFVHLSPKQLITDNVMVHQCSISLQSLNSLHILCNTCTQLLRRNTNRDDQMVRRLIDPSTQLPHFTEPNVWLPNSLNLNPLDYAVWAALQQLAYRQKIQDSERVFLPAMRQHKKPNENNHLLTFCVQSYVVIAVKPVHRLQICPILHNYRAPPPFPQVTSGSVQ